MEQIIPEAEIDCFEFSPKDLCVYKKKQTIKNTTKEKISIITIQNALYIQNLRERYPYIKIIEKVGKDE